MFSENRLFQWLSEIEGLRTRIRIGIYGSYFPLEQKTLIIDLRIALNRQAFETSYLVEDLPDYEAFKDDKFLKSQASLNFSNINLFVLTFQGQGQGVDRELDYVLHNPQLVFKCVVLPETEYDKEGNELHCCLSTLLKPDLAAVGMKISKFERGNLTDLVESCKGPITDLFYYYVKNRPQDIPDRSFDYPK